MGKYVVTAAQYNTAVKGDVIELDLDHFAEQDLLSTGQVEIASQEYKVIGASSVHGAAPGETFEAALPAGQAQLLLDGGFVEATDATPKLSAPVKGDKGGSGNQEGDATSSPDKPAHTTTGAPKRGRKNSEGEAQ